MIGDVGAGHGGGDLKKAKFSRLDRVILAGTCMGDSAGNGPQNENVSPHLDPVGGEPAVPAAAELLERADHPVFSPDPPQLFKGDTFSIRPCHPHRYMGDSAGKGPQNENVSPHLEEEAADRFSWL